MSEQTRKVKNPLLTAAGQGFPFEDYSTSAFLMPVTPATPAIIMDETPAEIPVAQEPVFGNLSQPEVSSEVGYAVGVQDLGVVPEAKDFLRKEPVDQPQRKGYFTSILSSLPNLSLSSITGEGSTVPQSTVPKQQQQQQPQQQEFFVHPGGSQGSSPYGITQSQYGSSTTSIPFVAADPTSDPSGHYSQGFSESRPIPPPTSSSLPRPPPITTALPPSGEAGSYRLGNQRRLKYAPPSDLTSNTPKQYSGPADARFLPSAPPQSSTIAAPEFFIPNTTSPTVSGSYVPSFVSSPNLCSIKQQQPPQLQPPSRVQQTWQAHSLTSLYNPTAVGLSGISNSSASAPQEIPSRIPEPATPQNTPANATFAGFASSYASAQPISLSSSDQADSRISAGFSSPPEVTRFSEGLTFDIPSSAFISSNIGSISGAIIEPEIPLSTEETVVASETGEDKSFTPISAAKVTAKLENLLAERKKDSPPLKSTSEFSSTASEEVKALEHKQQQSNVSNLESTAQKEKSETTEELAEIDLTTNEPFADLPTTQDDFVRSQIPIGTEFAPALGSESFARSGSHLSTPAETNVSSKSSSIANSFSQNQPTDPAPSAANFFNAGYEGTKAEVNYFTTTNEGSVPFVNFDSSISVPTPTSFFNSPHPTTGSNVPQSFFTPVSNTQQISSTTSAQPIPTFYNPNEFASASHDTSYPTFTPQNPTVPPLNRTSFATGFESSPPNFPTSASFAAAAMPEPTGSATLNPVQMSVNPGLARTTTEMVPPSLQSLAAGPAERKLQYRPVYHHWFYRKEVENKVLWLPFSMHDSLNLEDVHHSSEITPETTVATDGGRYDVDILRRRRLPVYWSGTPTEVRRSSWFYKGSTESRYIPYEESTSARLEEEFKQACLTDNWNRKIELNNGEYIIFHSSSIQVHYVPATSTELAASWGNSAGSETGTYLQGAASRPKVVKRGVDEFIIDEGEPEKVDHLLFLVHGIGSVCDLKFRTVEEVVDEFRSISLQLVESHYRTASMHGVVNRIEVLPISWHTTLHSEDTGIDKKLRAITLESIPKLRHFTNDTLLDILFYTSPIYCQTIMQTVGNEMNKLYSLFKERNPNFEGSVYLGGHSLGSLILFDLLCHQKPPAEEAQGEADTTNSPNPDSKPDDDTSNSIGVPAVPILKRRLSKKVSYVMGAAGTGQPFINYPQLSFHPQAFFALGSPIGMFVTVRGIDTLGEDFALPTCPAFFNVFHPFDPVAYRVESLIIPDAHKYRPMLIPHHKGRKRMHLELKETMARVGADLKQKFLDSVRSTWNSVYQLAIFHRPDNQSLEQEIDKVVEEQLHKSPDVQDQQNDDDGGADFRVGKLNGGRRIDYVLQEAPFEYINEYIFALTSHVCYWESEDTMLMILKEIYGTNGIQADAQLPPQTMTIERVSPSPSMASMPGASTSRQSPSGTITSLGMDPTAPIASKPVGPPPISGFVRKS